MTFGGERVEESAELSSFYAPGGGFEFFTDGHSPVSLEILSNGHYVNLGGGGGFGPELDHRGAARRERARRAVRVGQDDRRQGRLGDTSQHGKTIYYGRVPTKCPKGGFPLKTEVIFAENGEESKPETVDGRHTRRRARASKGTAGGFAPLRA